MKVHELIKKLQQHPLDNDVEVLIMRDADNDEVEALTCPVKGTFDNNGLIQVLTDYKDDWHDVDFTIIED
ncbi:hypothetical protein ACFL5C_03250 [Candidatus Omnitrophota bacterium]